jgi:hypothetical protein
VLWLIAGASALILFCSARFAWRKRANYAALLAFGCLGVLALPQAFQRSDDFHVAMAAPLTIGLLPVLAAAVARFAAKERFSSWAAGLTTIGCLGVLCLICPRTTEVAQLALRDEFPLSPVPEYAARNSARHFPLDSAGDAEAATRICQAIAQRSRPGQRLFVGPRDLRRTNYNDVYFYYLLPQLEPASYFIEMNPLSANRANSRMAADIQTADWIILDSELNALQEPNASAKNGPDAPGMAVRDHFVQVAQLNQFSVFMRRPGL